MKLPVFCSVFAASMRRYVAFRRVGGCSYRKGAMELALFDRFAAGRRLSRPRLTAALAAEYRESMPQVNSKVRYNRMCVLRRFSAFHHLHHPRSEVLRDLNVRRRERNRFILLHEPEVCELMQAADVLRGRRFTPDACRCLLGLLYGCGLRIGEALALRLEDIDKAGGALLVRRGKFGKSRQLPLSASAHAAVRRHLQGLAPRADGCTPLFGAPHLQPLSYSAVYRAFRRLLEHTGMRARLGPVRLHDLRHSFATAVLRRAVQAGDDPAAVLPRLAVFMGHVMLRSTQLYLHADGAALAEAGSRFRRAFLSESATPPPRRLP
jgi:integrase